ncbi:hypothetical protein NHX12_021240, partial [Muraenolepis orangiensis]
MAASAVCAFNLSAVTQVFRGPFKFQENSRDPYCGWDLVLKKCTTLEESVRMSQWEQSITKCPVSAISVKADAVDRTVSALTCPGYCNEHLPCPPHLYWSAWSSWERCTVPCGGGIQSRRRTCENGDECPGCSQKTTPWTPWTPVNISDNGGHYEQRFRYTCKARVTEASLLEVGRQRIEMRYCSSDGSTGCSTDVDGSWSCWSPWSRCSVTCGGGHYMRTRTCSNPPPAHGGDICLESWSSWSDWTRCNGAASHMRARHCDVLFPTGNQCSGNSTETRPCPPDSNFISEVSIARSSQEEIYCGDFNVFHMMAVGLSSSILGCLVTLLVFSYCQRYQRQSHDATVIHPVSAPLNTSITNHINKLDKYDSVEAIK